MGAQAELQRLYDLLQQDDAKHAILQWANVKEIDWHFTPSCSPHFGGLWEAAVHAMKSILTKVMGEHKLSYDELTTVLTSAEAVLNNRPLCSYETQDPEGVVPLTPCHFLTGGALIAPPQPPDTVSNISSLRRWNLVQHLSSILWKRWSKEYLNTLQKRTKWKVPNRDWSVGDIVLLKDEVVYQRNRPLGRVEEDLSRSRWKISGCRCFHERQDLQTSRDQIGLFTRGRDKLLLSGGGCLVNHILFHIFILTFIFSYYHCFYFIVLFIPMRIGQSLWSLMAVFVVDGSPMSNSGFHISLFTFYRCSVLC